MPISFPFRMDRNGCTAAPPDFAAWVREVLEMVLFTAPGERVMRPSFGTGVHQLVFAPASDEMASATQHLVRSALQQWLSEWVEVQDVAVAADGHRLTVTVTYLLRSTREQQRASLTREL
ncbi:MAG TPA: GPW/gp25 family protein [Polyangiaceae bacterium]|nr:GPW/gp25 family protein [Polyangiaceae bacterium]